MKGLIYSNECSLINVFGYGNESHIIMNNNTMPHNASYYKVTLPPISSLVLFSSHHMCDTCFRLFSCMFSYYFELGLMFSIISFFLSCSIKVGLQIMKTKIKGWNVLVWELSPLTPSCQSSLVFHYTAIILLHLSPFFESKSY